MSDQHPNPSDPNQGFPNPHSSAYQGERTPAEQYEYEQQEKARRAARGETEPTTAPATAEAAGSPAAGSQVVAGSPPANPTGTDQAAY